MTEQNEIEHREHELKTFPRYRKKPVEIEAFQLGVHPYLPDWFMDKLSANDIVTHGRDYGPIEWAEIKTLEGIMRVERGDWIIKGVKGEIYPCKPDIFAMTYESAAQQADAWQPIESAPDKTPLLVFDGKIICAAERDGVWWLCFGATGWECENVFDDPTHWMPLPTPPQATGV